MRSRRRDPSEMTSATRSAAPMIRSLIMPSRSLEMKTTSGWVARRVVSTISSGAMPVLPKRCWRTQALSKSWKRSTISWWRNVGAGDITSSPSHSSVGRLLSGNSATNSSKVHRRSFQEAGTGLGLAAITGVINRGFRLESSFVITSRRGAEVLWPIYGPYIERRF